MIYFDRATQTRAVETLTRLLKQAGVLFVGPSETGVALDTSFVQAKLPMAFAFRKRPDTRTAQPARSSRRKSPRINANQQATAPPVRASHMANPQRVDELAHARQLADAGRLTDAARVCRNHLEIDGPSAAAFHLLGLIAGAAGDAHDAIECFRKTLYLDPRHEDSLVHLAALLESDGHAAEARRLRSRARRVSETGPPR